MIATGITQRQQDIIEAAGKILTSSGVNGLTTKNLAREMNFTESALYRHFSGKKDIIMAMLQYLARTMESRLAEVTAPLSAPEEMLAAIFRDHLSWFSSHPHFAVAVFSDGLMEESPEVNAAIQQIMQVKMKFLAPVIQRGQEEGVFTDAVPSAHLIHIAMASIRLQMLKWRTAGFDSDIEAEGEKILQSILFLFKNH